MKERENKIKETRRKILDELLSDRAHEYTWGNLVSIVNSRMGNVDRDNFCRRTIEKDVDYLKYDPYYAEIEKVRRIVFNEEKKKNVCNVIIRYKDPTFSIYKKPISNEEKNLLREVLSTIGQFEGLENFTWLDNFKKSLNVEDSQRKVISFSNNQDYLDGLKVPNLLGTLFNMISNKVVIQVSYHTFNDPTIRSRVFHPYLLKQYNNRWFLLGADDSDMFILNFALDRIDKVEPLPGRKYKECPVDLAERFEEIVGVTLYKNRPVEHILCWVNDVSRGYVETKPIHGTFTPIRNKENELKLRNKYPQLQGGLFFTLDCICNKELIRELTSFGKDLLVLESHADADVEVTAKDEVEKRIREMMEEYDKLRT